MAFESLSEKLQNTFKKLKGKGVLTEADINDAMSKAWSDVRSYDSSDLLTKRVHRAPHGRTSGNRKDHHLRKAGDLP